MQCLIWSNQAHFNFKYKDDLFVYLLLFLFCTFYKNNHMQDKVRFVKIQIDTFLPRMINKLNLKFLKKSQ